MAALVGLVSLVRCTGVKGEIPGDFRRYSTAQNAMSQRSTAFTAHHGAAQHVAYLQGSAKGEGEIPGGATLCLGHLIDGVQIHGRLLL